MYKHPYGFGSPARVLMIEDDAGYARLVEILLAESDLLSCEIEICTTLAAGLAAMDQEQFAAILLDLNLPDSQGFETLQKVLHHSSQRNVIVLTGRFDRQMGIQAVKAGAQDFLVKGNFDDAQLAKVLRYSIERNHILCRLEEAQRIAQVGHWECHPAQGFFHASDETYRIFGLEPDGNLPGKESMSDQGRPQLEALLACEEEARKQGHVKKDLQVVRPDGQTAFLSLQCQATEISEGQYVFSGIVQDITERQQAEELRKARDLAQQVARIREQMVASVSHEMRTPMNAILGMTNLLLSSQLNEEQHSFVRSIKQSSEVLLGIINDILQISSIQNEALVFDKKAFDLRELIEQLRTVMQSKVGEKALNFRTTIAPNIPGQIVGDKIRLSQILFNLVGNAIKFTDRGFIDLRIQQLERTEQTTRLRFDLEDTGIGIPADKLKTIFDMFTRVQRKDRLSEGTGLGLAIAKQLVEQQGGTIRVVSEEGIGSTFSVELSFQLAERPADNTQQVYPHQQIDPDTCFHVLVVEDHQINQLVIRKTLEKQWPQVRVIMADHGNEAISILRKQQVDIILMDLLMPVRDGYETAIYIRNEMPEQIAGLPILAMTAHAHISEDGKYHQYGMDDYILKPFDPQELFHKISYHLAKDNAP